MEHPDHSGPRSSTEEPLLTEELFALLTRYLNQGDNLEDNRKRAQLLGFGGREICVAPGVTVTAGVKIGGKNLICANAVVTRDTPDYAIMAGTPARQIGSIHPETGAYLWHKEG